MEIYDATPKIQNLLLMDSEGKRIAVKYYCDTWKTVAAQSTYEKDVFSKINRGQQRSIDGDILLFNEVSVVYKRVGDLIFVVTGSQEENEVILYTVLQAFSEALNILLRGVVEKKTVLENLDLVLITIDETIDDGIVLEIEAQVLAQRATMRTDAVPEMSFGEQLQMQTFSQALANAKTQLARSLLS